MATEITGMECEQIVERYTLAGYIVRRVTECGIRTIEIHEHPTPEELEEGCWLGRQVAECRYIPGLLHYPGQELPQWWFEEY